MTPVVLTFLGSLLCFVVIGLLSSVKSKSSVSDYLLAGHSVKPWLAALSAVATTNSGYMFIGMIGYTYMVGLSSMWLAIGWVLGDLIISFFVHPRLRAKTETSHSLSFSELLGKWSGTSFRGVSILSAILTILFLSVYAAAQLKAGGKALHVLFGWDLTVGAIIGTIIVMLYCVAGGIRASIWTDAAQSMVMIVAMCTLFVVGVASQGGIHNTIQSLNAISPTFLSAIPHPLPFGSWWGFSMFLMGWLFAGIAVIGQPHIMVRFMAMDSVRHMRRVRVYYYAWYIAFYALTVAVGMLARLYLANPETFDAELALPMMSLVLLPKILVGIILSGLFSAAMSTADSQILSCTAAITRDLFPVKKRAYIITKAVTIGISITALLVALIAPANVFNLVMIAWSALGAAFGPLIILYCLKKPMTQPIALTVMITGIAVTLLWRWAGLSDSVYETFPGIVSGFVAYWLFAMIQKHRQNTVKTD